MDASFPGDDALFAARRAAVSAHRFTDDDKQFDAYSTRPVLINGFNQRADLNDGATNQTLPPDSKWCCACYVGPYSRLQLQEKTKETMRLEFANWHWCMTCRCYLHSAVVCKQVKQADEGELFCGHCFDLRALGAGAPNQPPPASPQPPPGGGGGPNDAHNRGGMDDNAPENDDNEDFVTGAQPAKRQRHQRCKNCGQPGHNTRSCGRR